MILLVEARTAESALIPEALCDAQSGGHTSSEMDRTMSGKKRIQRPFVARIHRNSTTGSTLKSRVADWERDTKSGTRTEALVLGGD